MAKVSTIDLAMWRSLSNIRGLVALSAVAVLLGLAAGCKSSGEKAAAKPAEEKSPAKPPRSNISYKVPDEVKEEITAQLKRVFNEARTRGVPLLDLDSKWFNFEKWPDRFKFLGVEFKAQYGNLGPNAQGPVDSRAKLRFDSGYFVRYDIMRPNNLPLHSFYSFWSGHGYVKETGVDWNGQNIFSLQYYQDGNLYSFGHSKPGGTTRRDYYDFGGVKIGSRDDSNFTWAGQKVTRDTFLKNLREMVRGRFPAEV